MAFSTVPSRLTHMVMAVFFLALHLFTTTLTLYRVLSLLWGFLFF